jgi:pimeloyl-ACP methyl ester carboxylesterase
MLRIPVHYLFVVLTLLALAGPASAQTLTLEDCRISAGPGHSSIKARCGTMLRPENPADPNSSEIEVKVAVVAALNLSPQADPVVPIAGGPGQGSIEFYSMVSDAFEKLRRNRDILLVDQRGTGDSSRMDCVIDDDAILFEDQYSLEDTVEFIDKCLEELPHDPRYFTTSVAVTDLDARRYPESTRTVTIDGVVPPQIALGPEIATESQMAVDNILARCEQDASCRESFPNIAATFARVVAELRDSSVQVLVPHPNTGRIEEVSFGTGQLAGAVRLLAYNPNTVALLPLMIHEAGEGNFVPLTSQFMLTAVAMSDSLALGMHNSIMCTEDIPFLDRATIDQDSIDASYMGSFQLETLEAICASWPAGPIDSEFKVPLATNIPFLLLSGDADPITPPRYAEMAAVDLTSAAHLIGKHQGHGQLAVGCMNRIVAEFVNSADPASIDATCMERSFVMPFFVGFSGPSP